MATFTITAGLSSDSASVGWSAPYAGADFFGSDVANQSDIADFMTVFGFYVTYDDEYHAYLHMVTTGPLTQPTQYPGAFTSIALTITPPVADAVTLAGDDALVTYLQYGDNFGSTDPLDARMVWTWDVGTLGELFEDGEVTTLTLTATEAANVSFNCECDDANSNETLSELRERMMVRLGYAAQLASPPPGMEDLLNGFLQGAQKFLYRRYTPLRTERFFTWALTTGVRYYDLPDNLDTCTKPLDTLKISAVHIQDVNGVWVPLNQGISPTLYTSESMYGMPYRYEIRQCIEVFPAPDTRYLLRVKGDFGLEAFAADGDKTTLDSELVFLEALANAKAHYGQPDADTVRQQANTYRLALIGASHQTARYIPGTKVLPSVPKPIFLPLQDGEG